MHPQIAKDVEKLFGSKLGTGSEVRHKLTASDPSPVTREAIIRRPYNAFDEGRVRVDRNFFEIVLPTSAGLAIGHFIELAGVDYKVVSIELDGQALKTTGVMRAT